MTMRLEFATVDVFAAERFGGNPLAVVFGADALAPELMQRIAREFALSETVFVLAPAHGEADHRLRIFTPAMELPFAGHPNVGSAFVLSRRAGGARRLVLEQPAGLVVAEIDGDMAEIAAPQAWAHGGAVEAAHVAACLSLPEKAIRTDRHKPLRSGVGTVSLQVELAGPEALAAAAPDLAAFRTHLASVPGARGVLAYWREREDLVRCRYLAPLQGIPEDPATGSANAALAGLLLWLSGHDHIAFTSHQGVEMGRPSELRLSAVRDAAGEIRVRLGGRSVPVLAGTLDLGPDDA